VAGIDGGLNDPAIRAGGVSGVLQNVTKVPVPKDLPYAALGIILVYVNLNGL